MVEELRNRIAIIGELNIDLIAIGLDRSPVLGLEILADDFQVTLGSASAIFACGIAQLGNDVTFISRVGRDDFGDFCIEALERKGISTAGIEQVTGQKTGVTFVMSTAGDRALVTFPGTMSTFRFNDYNALGGYDHLHLTSYFLQTALQQDFPRIMEEARKRGLTISFDPNSDPSEKWDEEIFETIAATDILFLNEPEAKQLTSYEDVGQALALLGTRCQCVVIKLGSKGAIAIRDGSVVSADGFSVPTVDTTGAGDSFAAGFVHAYHSGADLPECLTIANACGALSTTCVGGTEGQPDLSGLNRFLEKLDV